MSDYPPLALNQLAAIPDQETIMVTGIYSRHVGHAVLTQGEQRLQLLGEPFSWLPPQGSPVRIWGQLLQGKQRRLLVHDACHVSESERELCHTPMILTNTTITLTVQVSNIGDEQIARTADRHLISLIGEELDERRYILHGNLITLNPPTLVILQAIPICVSKSSFS